MRTKRTKPSDKTQTAQDAVAVRRYLPLRDAIKQFCDQLLKDGTDTSIVEAWKAVSFRVHECSKSGVYVLHDFVREAQVFDDRFDYATLKSLVSQWNSYLANMGRLQVLPSMFPEEEEIFQLI